MIIWLASYPKSGNTWVRSIITSLINTTNGEFDFEKLKFIDQFPEKKYFKNLVRNFGDINEISKNWNLAQEEINLDNKIRFFKTHHGKYTVNGYNFTSTKNYIATIYIVRDPRNLVKSISNHYSLNVDDAFKFLSSPEIIGNKKSWDEKRTGMVNILGNWNDHYRSWTRDKNNLLIIKYEDLISNTANELKKIVIFLKKYLKFETNESKNKRILETTSFSNLRKMEKQGLFKENVINKNDNSKVEFFHMGPENKWQNNLKKDFVREIEKKFYNEMKELNYL
tara:strand:+ start:2146 stop:2988 length:843 start_codon:yes stop_codon:yes gene_type:complete